MTAREQDIRAKLAQLEEQYRAAVVAGQATAALEKKITGLKDNEVTLQVQEGVRIRFLRSSITGVYSGDAPKTDKSTMKASPRSGSGASTLQKAATGR